MTHVYNSLTTQNANALRLLRTVYAVWEEEILGAPQKNSRRYLRNGVHGGKGLRQNHGCAARHLNLPLLILMWRRVKASNPSVTSSTGVSESTRTPLWMTSTLSYVATMTGQAQRDEHGEKKHHHLRGGRRLHSNFEVV